MIVFRRERPQRSNEFPRERALGHTEGSKSFPGFRALRVVCFGRAVPLGGIGLQANAGKLEG